MSCFFERGARGRCRFHCSPSCARPCFVFCLSCLVFLVAPSLISPLLQLFPMGTSSVFEASDRNARRHSEFALFYLFFFLPGSLLVHSSFSAKVAVDRVYLSASLFALAGRAVIVRDRRCQDHGQPSYGYFRFARVSRCDEISAELNLGTRRRLSAS